MAAYNETILPENGYIYIREPKKPDAWATKATQVLKKSKIG